MGYKGRIPRFQLIDKSEWCKKHGSMWGKDQFGNTYAQCFKGKLLKEQTGKFEECEEA